WSSQINAGGGYDDEATTLTVDDASGLAAIRTANNNAWLIVLVEATGELLRVTLVSSNILSVTRGWGGTTAASIADDAPLSYYGLPNCPSMFFDRSNSEFL